MKIYILRAEDQSRSGWDTYVLGYYVNSELAANALWDVLSAASEMGYEPEFVKDPDGKYTAITYYSSDGMRHNAWYDEATVVDSWWE